MLKIAEYNTITGEKIDLKELEKYGFSFWENGCGTTGYSYDTIRGSITIVEKDKEYNNKYNDERMIMENDIVKNIDLFYDLIKDGLIEKVDQC